MRREERRATLSHQPHVRPCLWLWRPRRRHTPTPIHARCSKAVGAWTSKHAHQDWNDKLSPMCHCCSYSSTKCTCWSAAWRHSIPTLCATSPRASTAGALPLAPCGTVRPHTSYSPAASAHESTHIPSHVKCDSSGAAPTAGHQHVHVAPTHERPLGAPQTPRLCHHVLEQETMGHYVPVAVVLGTIHLHSAQQQQQKTTNRWQPWQAGCWEWL